LGMKLNTASIREPKQIEARMSLVHNLYFYLLELDIACD